MFIVLGLGSPGRESQSAAAQNVGFVTLDILGGPARLSTFAVPTSAACLGKGASAPSGWCSQKPDTSMNRFRLGGTRPCVNWYKCERLRTDRHL